MKKEEPTIYAGSSCLALKCYGYKRRY